MLTRRHFCIVSQVYPPDPAAVGQHLADVAEELCRRGHAVTVLTSDRAYDNPSQRYQRFERSGEVRIVRLPLSSFGKGSLVARLLSGSSLLLQALVLITPFVSITDVLLSTAPHLSGALGIALNSVRGLPFHYWLMDLNPDQIVASGRMRADAKLVRAFDWLNTQVLAKAATITTLDPLMAARFASKTKRPRTIAVQPPWAPQAQAAPERDASNSFRSHHGLTTERVVMHAGNHSAVHPLDTLVAAIRGAHQSELRYFFVGGGVGKRHLEHWVSEERPSNVTLLPYQPRAELDSMLSAADLHIVTVGNDTIGIVHPSKLYGALAAGRPVLVFGPRRSPAAELVRHERVGWHVEHGDVEGALRALLEFEQLPEAELRALQRRAANAASGLLSRELGVSAFCDRLLSGSHPHR